MPEAHELAAAARVLLLVAACGDTDELADDWLPRTHETVRALAMVALDCLQHCAGRDGALGLLAGYLSAAMTAADAEAVPLAGCPPIESRCITDAPGCGSVNGPAPQQERNRT
jgi:hypothetical protein